MPILSAKWMCEVTAEELARALRSDSSAQIPLLAERLRGLHEAGSVLLNVCAIVARGSVSAASFQLCFSRVLAEIRWAVCQLRARR